VEGDREVGLGLGQLLEELAGAVLGAVVDEDDLLVDGYGADPFERVRKVWTSL